jgi:Fur family ferric uptake transcriptional regulator
MTVSADAQPLAVTSLADAVVALRERGLRISTTRRLLLEALLAADGPVSAEYAARHAGLDAASVHRNLDTFERIGLVRHVHLGHGPGLYALLGRGEREYLYCDRCGAVEALAPAELDPVRERINSRYGYRARFDHFAIVGTCPACSDAQAAGTPDRGEQRDRRDDHSHSHGDHVHGRAHGRGEHEHSHGDHVHAHPRAHADGA